MSRKRLYTKTTGYWVYAHTTPNGMYYIGMSKQQPCERWQKSHYKTPNSLAQYIEKYGWENIEHRVLIDGLTKEQAEQIEDWFIRKATADGFCINERRSGGVERDDRKAYNKQWYEDHKEERKAYNKQRNKQYREEHTEELKAYDKQWYEEHKEEIKAYNKERNSTPECKIYNRVASYNQRHTPIETPMEAKQKYLEWGYIPTYIKNDDLC